MRRLLGLVVALAAASSMLAVTAGTALATHVGCGDVVTADVTLDSDLLGCAYPALTVAGDHITLDLDGHVVEGGVEAPMNDIKTFTDLVIEGGTVVGGGIHVDDYDDVTIQHMTVDGIGLGRDGGRLWISQNVMRGAPFGFGISHSGAVTLSDNLIEGNEVGVDAAHTGLVTLLRNTIRANGYRGVGGGQGGDYLAIGNKIVDNGGTGVSVNESNTTLKGNLIARNAGDGISAEFVALDAQKNTIMRNEGSGIYAAIGSVKLIANATSRNGVDGITIGERTSGVLRANHADRNGGHGIHVGGAESTVGPVTITGNHTWFNGDLGIDSDAGRSAGGGNWAKHNGNPAQCVPRYLCSAKGKPKK